MKRKYIYLFTIGNKIVHSGETEDSLRNRVEGKGNTDSDRREVEQLIRADMIGNYCSISTGEFIVQVSI
jgi:hypothetical protein